MRSWKWLLKSPHPMDRKESSTAEETVLPHGETSGNSQRKASLVNAAEFIKEIHSLIHSYRTFI